MKIIAISDLHGQLPELPECDLVLIAGDICPSPYFPEIKAAIQHAYWLDSDFRPWLQKLRCKQVVGIGGNHDVLFEGKALIKSLQLPWVYLQDDGYEFEGMKIWGCPWSVPPVVTGGKWPFEWTFACATEKEAAKKASLIPSDTDILVSHAPPFTICDVTKYGKMSAGSSALLNRVQDLRLKLHVFGHIHEGFGRMYIGDTVFANCSYMTETDKAREFGWQQIILE